MRSFHFGSDNALSMVKSMLVMKHFRAWVPDQG
jgi:hypothetical protein